MAGHGLCVINTPRNNGEKKNYHNVPADSAADPCMETHRMKKHHLSSINADCHQKQSAGDNTKWENIRQKLTHRTYDQKKN